MINWVVCRGNSGYLVNNGLRERRKTAFDNKKAEETKKKEKNKTLKKK